MGPAGHSEAVRATVRALQVDRVAVDAATVLDAAAVPFLLLKGAGTSDLLYAGGPGRNYADVDLLVPRAALTAAGRALDAAGFVCEADDTADDRADRVQPHSQVWRRPGSEIDVDLHFELPGARGDVWDALHGGRVALDLGDRAVPVPGPEARALHVALHAWQHRGRHDRSRRDLERAVAVLDDATWQQAARLAGEIGASDALALALAAVPGGAQLASRLGLGDDGRAPLDRLWMADPPAGTIMLGRLRAATTGRERAALAREIVLPPRIVLERSTGRPLDRRAAYLAAAARRLLAAPAQLVPALRAYRAATR